MAVRTNYVAVGLIIDTTLNSGQVTQFIADASVWVDENLTGEGLSDAVLEQIERYLAAHFITMRDPRLTGTDRGEVSDKLQRDSKVSEYLKAAAGLDPTGRISQAFVNGRRRKAVVDFGDPFLPPRSTTP